MKRKPRWTLEILTGALATVMSVVGALFGLAMGAAAGMDAGAEALLLRRDLAALLLRAAAKGALVVSLSLGALRALVAVLAVATTL